MDRKLLHVVVCAALSGSTALAAGPTDVDYGATVVTGFDSNPLRVSKEIPSEPGIFGQLRLDGGLKHPLGPAFSFFANGEIRGRFHDAAMRNADFGSGRATVGLQLAPRNAPRFLLAAGARHAAVRRTYTDRATGQIYEVLSNPDPDPPSTVEIGDRLDYDSNELFLNMRWRQNERLLLFVDSRFEQASFLESYANTTSLESLDFRAVTVEPGLSVQLHRVARLAFSVSRTELDYLDQSSLDAAGFRVAGQTRRYEYTRYRLSLSVKPARRWNFLIGARSADRDDAYAGYYDYGAISSFISIDRQIGSRATLRVYGSYSDLTYDNATVSGDPTEQILDSEVRTVLVRFDRKFGRRTAWFVESGARRTDSHDPVFANDSDWVLGGVQFRKR